MRLGDAISTLQLGKNRRKKYSEVRTLCTVWSEGVDDSPGAVPLPEYPRPQLKRDKWRSLNGWWEYAIRPASEAFQDPFCPDGRILVPYSPETRRSGVERTLMPGEKLWYRCLIKDLEVPDGKRLLLHFGAVDERCRVYWNRRKAGDHANGYLPFSFDVTDYVSDGENELIVCVRDDTDQSNACRGKQTLSPGGMYYHAQSGIWQTVWLEEVPELYLKSLRITPDIRNRQVFLSLTFRDERNPDARNDFPQICLTCEGRSVYFNNTAYTDNTCTASINSHNIYNACPVKSGNDINAQIMLPVQDLRLWTPEDPYLYPLKIQAGEESADAYFAMRSFGTGTDEKGRPCLTFNEKPYFFHGVLDQGYWPESLMTPPSDEAMIFDIREIKKLSFNMIRKHIKVEPLRWYYHCDRIGMIVWQDMVNGGGPVNKLLETYLPNIVPAITDHLRDNRYALLSRSSEAARKVFEEDLIRMIRHLYNCPCIGLWTPFNEGWGQFDALRITDLIRKEDPTRPIDHASGWFDQGGGDIRSIHNYFRKLRVEEDCHGARSCVLSEYGGYNCNVEGHSMSSEVYGYHTYSEEEYPHAFHSLMDEIGELKEDGLSGAVYTQLSDIEEETNGIFTYDRKICKLREIRR